MRNLLLTRGWRSARLVPVKPMEVVFRDSSLDRLEVDAKFDAGFSRAVVKAFRKRMQYIRGAADERAFYEMKSLHFEKLKGDRKEQHSMKLNDQWRLIVKLEKKSEKTVVEILTRISTLVSILLTIGWPRTPLLMRVGKHSRR